MKLLCIDDHELVRIGMRSFADQLGSTLFLEATSLGNGLAVLQKNPDIDLVLLDISLPDAHGVTGLQQLRAEFPDIPVAIITGTLDRQLMVQTLNMGAVGFIPKSALAQRLLAALKLILSGERYIPEELLTAAISPDPAPPGAPSTPTGEMLPPGQEPASRPLFLTPRQEEIARLLAAGLSNKEICRELGLSLGTIKHHLAGIFRSVGASTRAKAVFLLNQSLKK